MPPAPLEVSPLARFLVSLAARRATGQVALGERSLFVRNGQLVGISPLPEDESFAEFLCHSGRATAEQVDAARQQAEAEGLRVDQLLVRNGQLSELDASSARRALWLDRLAKVFAQHGADRDPPNLLPPAPATSDAPPYSLLKLVLDALARDAVRADAEHVGQRLKHRLEWLGDDPLQMERAQAWAALGELPERPTLAGVLSRNPAGAPLVAALVRSGFATLTPAADSVPPPASSDVLPSVAPRAPSIPPAALPAPALPSEPAADAADATQVSEASRGDRCLPRTNVRQFPVTKQPLEDPLVRVEQQIEALEQPREAAAGETNADTRAERSRLWCDAARLWLERYGSMEEAARCYREAAAAEPTGPTALRQAAQLCFVLGQSNLADAYAAGAITAATNSRERGFGLRLRASIAHARGDSAAAMDALCEACAEDELDPEPHVLIAHALAAEGNLDGAVTHARMAVANFGRRAPARQCAIATWAHLLRPEDSALCMELAELLDAQQHRTAAIAVLTATARLSTSGELRRSLLLHAASRASRIKRHDLAAEALLEAFAADPEADVLYVPLLRALEHGAVSHSERAVVAQEIAERCPAEQQSTWLMHAADAFEQSPRGHDAALLLLARAVRAAPLRPQALKALRKRATTALGRALFGDALSHAAEAHASETASLAVPLFEELAEFAERRLHAAGRAQHAWRRVLAIAPEHPSALAQLSRLAAKHKAQQAILLQAERELNEARGNKRAHAARKLAALLRDVPEQRARACELYREYLQAHADDEAASAALESLLEVVGDDKALANFLEQRLARSLDATESVRLLSRLAATCARRGETQGLADACMAQLALAPESSEAIARLERAAARLRQPGLLRAAYVARAQRAGGARGRSRALSGLAHLLETHNELDAAVAAADASLVADASSADAALLLLRHHSRLAPDRAVRALHLARVALGDSGPLLAALAEGAHAAGSVEAKLEALHAWFRLTPLDPDVSLRRLDHAVVASDAREVAALANAALDPVRVHSGNWSRILSAVTRLVELDEPEQAAKLALLALRRTGRADPQLAKLAVQQAERSRNLRLLRDALEFRAASCREPQRTEALIRLAQLQRGARRPAAEVRTLLRVVARTPRDPGALSRLATLYAEAGDAERLLAVLSLGLDSGPDPTARQQCLLDLAAAAAQVAKEPERAKTYVKTLALECANDGEQLTAALGALRALGELPWALSAVLRIAEALPPRAAALACAFVASSAEQELGDVSLAYRAAIKGLEHQPSHPGALYRFERLALSMGAVKDARAVFARLIDSAPGPHTRRARMFHAGRWHERAGELTAAASYYLQAFDLRATRGALLKAIQRVCRDGNRYGPLVRAYTALADAASAPEVRVEYLQLAAELGARELRNHGQAFALRKQAYQTLPLHPLDHAALGAAIRLRALDAAAGDEALRQMAAESEQQLRRMPPQRRKAEGLLRLAELEFFDLRRSEEALHTLEEAEALAEDLPPDPQFERTLGQMCALLHDPKEASDAPGRLRAELCGEPDSSPQPADQPEAAFAVRANEALALAARPEQATEAIAPLCELLRLRPWESSWLRALHGALATTKHPGLAPVSELVRLFEPSVRPTPPAPGAQAAFFRQPPLPGARALGRLLALTEVALAGTELFEVASDAALESRLEPVRVECPAQLTRVYAEVASELGLGGTPLYLAHPAPSQPAVLPRWPAAVLASRELETEPTLLRFRFARALERSRPGHALVSALPQPRVEQVLFALPLAFGRAPETAASDAAHEHAERLRRALPVQYQQEAEALLERFVPALDYDRAHQVVERTALRVALQQCGSLRAALIALHQDEAVCEGEQLQTESGFERACRASAALAELVRCALPVDDASLPAAEASPHRSQASGPIA